MGKIAAIVGRPNVGKSTLFNRLVGMRQAIVDETPGVTRDRIYGKSDWNGKEFSVIDTGGYAVNTEDVFEEEIRKQALFAIEEADMIIFMTDVACGITDFDAEMAEILRRSSKKVFLAVNKVDNYDKIYSAAEFYSLGLGEPFCISSVNGSGTGELLDAIVKEIPDNEAVVESPEIPRITITGKPNVGKSSMINAFLGEERNIVTDIPGTTRDSIGSRYKKYGFDFFLIDTAGMRKKTKVKEDLEFYSVMRAVRSIEHSDICILVIDAESGIEAQDMNIFRLIIRNKKGCVIAVNKWDLAEKDSGTAKKYKSAIIKKTEPNADIPVVFTSVLNKVRIFDVLKESMKVYENMQKRISTAKLNDEILPEIKAYPPPAVKGKHVKIKYVTQLPVPTPTFAFFCNLPQYIKDPYLRFLENKIRSKFDFTGSPVTIVLRQK